MFRSTRNEGPLPVLVSVRISCGTFNPSMSGQSDVLTWTLYREGAAADWLREDLDDMLRPHPMRGDIRRSRRI